MGSFQCAIKSPSRIFLSDMRRAYHSKAAASNKLLKKRSIEELLKNFDQRKELVENRLLQNAPMKSERSALTETASKVKRRRRLDSRLEKINPAQNASRPLF